ncbi:hypothetical protein KY285_005368 [Solanum tuberosum]|nr:hypothetical protein KY285_005368 [Solanum tuberosum]
MSETLHRIFSAYGEIKDAFVVRDKFSVSKEYGFVIFKNIRSMLMALKEPYKSIDGKMTITKIARSRIRDVEDESLRTIYVSMCPEKGPFGFDKETGKSIGHNLTCEMAIPKTMMKNPHVGPNLDFDFGPGLHDHYNNARSRFDGCSSRLEVSQKDKPWMSQLAAVASLSIAAKMEETQVPLLLDLQVADSRFVFEAKTIQRMELLVLSTLNWKMNLVTPLSFIHHIMRRFGFMTNLHLDFLNKCERLILDIITGEKPMRFRF